MLSWNPSGNESFDEGRDNQQAHQAARVPVRGETINMTHQAARVSVRVETINMPIRQREFQ